MPFCVKESSFCFIFVCCAACEVGWCWLWLFFCIQSKVSWSSFFSVPLACFAQEAFSRNGKKVNTDYHSRAKSLDARGGDTRDGFEAELNSYGQGGRVLGPVIGAFGEMSDDVKELANAVAEELAVEHCSFCGDKTSKAVKGFFLNQVYRSWGHTAHRGWARLLLDRRSLVQVPNAPRRRARADDRYYEENIMESYFHPESDHHINSGP